MGLLFTAEDTPTGSWATRYDAVESIALPVATSSRSSLKSKKAASEKVLENAEAQEMVISTIANEVVVAPTAREALRVIFSLQTLALAAPYACTFGGELAINSIIGSYYLKNFPQLNQTGSGRWAAMFGLLNVLFRPLGGIVADILYHHTNSIWAKKLWLTVCGIKMGCFELCIGLVNPHREATMFGLVADFAVFMDASNGANYAVVPHVHPHANGVLSGTIGGCGNLGGIIFAILFKYNRKNYTKVIWIIGVISITVNLAVSWIRPVSKKRMLM